MDNAIVAIQMGSTHHTDQKLGINNSQDQAASYRLARQSLFTILKASPSFETGPRHSDVSLHEIEAQRVEFVRLNSHSFGQPC
jgi:hypothetical protein